MSKFNTEYLCPNCEEKEKRHPLYGEADLAETAAVAAGDLDFPGIGCPPELLRISSEEVLTAEQISRQDHVDNAVFNLVSELLPEKYRSAQEKSVQWDIQWISELREQIEEILRASLGIEPFTEKAEEFGMEFYPFLQSPVEADEFKNEGENQNAAG